MSIDLVNVDVVKVIRPDQKEPSPPIFPAPGTPSPPAADQVLLSHKNSRQPAAFLAKKEEHAAAAGDLRRKDQVLESLGQKVGALKEPLQAIVKQFPPYGREDQERVKLMKQYAALRKEIDSLTVPRPREDDAAQPGTPFPAALPVSATDSQIADHLNDLDAAGAGFRQLRGRFALEAARSAREGAVSTAFSAGFGRVLPLSAAASDESAALSKSVEVGQQIASTMGQGVTASNSHYLKSLG